MRIREIITFLFLISFLIPCGLFGQVSQGGLPIQIPETGLKSLKAENDVIVMPAVDNELMRIKYNQPYDIKLKPFQFAVSFDVNLNTTNSGNWQTVGDVNVWQLKIRSSDAYSINLILDQYILPKDARLFLINEQYGDIKGAYTSANNSESRILAIEPVQGDELIVQYEEPVNSEFHGEFRIYKIAHDFIGITGDKLHRPLGVSGACNININCDIADEVELMRDAVCRIMIEGREFCTGALMNNTGYDGIPYVLTACHCIPTQIKAQTSVFLFNYESPYCSVYNSPPIDGDVSHSISGSSLKSSFDSLDFALVRLDMIPSYPFRPYLLGWNRLAVAPSNSICIHHPWGDIKKYSKDLNPPVTGTFPGSIYQQNGFWNVKVWEYGVTEPGASGAPFLDQNKYVVGVLTGGAASCTSRKNDFFTKFNLAWDYRKEPDKQLKVWLDPINSAFQKIDGMFLFPDPKLQCKPITNFNNDDTNTLIRIPSGLTNKGYWSGTNSAGYTDFAEKYSFSKNCEIQGINLGIAKRSILSLDKSIEIQVYSGKTKPETLIYSESYPVTKLYPDAMNYFKFKTPVKAEGTFFVSFNISQLESKDTVAVYMANPKSGRANTYFLKNKGIWSTYTSHNTHGNGSTLLTELVVCNVDDPNGIEDLSSDLAEAKIFPNPLIGNSLLNIETKNNIDFEQEVAIYDLLGKKQNIPYSIVSPTRMTLNFSGMNPGTYLVKFVAGDQTLSAKVAKLP